MRDAMGTIQCEAPAGGALSRAEIDAALDRYVAALPTGVRKVLLLPPDATRRHSGAGWLTEALYGKLEDRAEITVMPATGTHRPMTAGELAGMFGGIPSERFAAHHWRTDTELLGVVPAEVVGQLSAEALTAPLAVTVNRRLLSGEFDLMVSIGQVVPHEVVGMANYSKNILVGVGGEAIINQSHYLGALYGLERLIGRDHSPVRRLYDYAQQAFLARLPIHYVLTANTTDPNPATGLNDFLGLYIGVERSVFEAAVQVSRRANITYLDAPVKTFVVYLDPSEFRSTWVGCKAIYRTRLAVADGGEIVVVAPGLERLGEDERFDRLIRKYGYVGTPKIVAQVREQADLRANLAVAAHLMHGSTEGRFKVTFASDTIDRATIEGVNFEYLSLAEAKDRYAYDRLADGPQQAAGQPVYYVGNPAAGLWVARERFDGPNL